jgi:AmmeMemoRadiSam system protein A
MEKENNKPLNEQQGRILLELARKTIAGKLGVQGDADDASLAEKLTDRAFEAKRGTFVTLTIGGCLRGCIGSLTATESIKDGIRRNAINSAFNDNRFMLLTVDEFKKLAIEISILTEPRELEYTDGADLVSKLRPQVDGVILRKGYSSATFLPQVWEQLPNVEDFLGHLCMKAGLPSDMWKASRLAVSTYQVQKFKED